MERFGIITNSEKDENMETTRLIEAYLASRGKTCLNDSRYFDNIDALLVLGGDGTLIQAARKHVCRDVPIMGINLGTLGFLTSVEKDEVLECLDCLIEDKYTIERRMMLRGKVWHKRQLAEDSVAVNDIIVTRSGFSRLVEVRLFINGNLVDIYAGDGIIVSTPTGSTGYNLSAGGPIVYPETELMVITPICPHSLSARSIVVSGREKVRIEIGKRRKTQPEEALVTYDGQTAVNLESSDCIEIGEAAQTVKLIKINNRSFYEVLRSKIGNV